MLWAACGGPGKQQPEKAPDRNGISAISESAEVSAGKAALKPPAELPPVEIDVAAARVGNSVRLDVTGIGRFRRAPAAMEKPENWIVHALAQEQMLPRVVNGSVKVERFQVGDPSADLWDVEVRFSMAYSIPADASEVLVRITAPDTPMFERRLPAPVPPEPETKKDAKKPGKKKRRSGKR